MPRKGKRPTTPSSDEDPVSSRTRSKAGCEEKRDKKRVKLQDTDPAMEEELTQERKMSNAGTVKQGKKRAMKPKSLKKIQKSAEVSENKDGEGIDGKVQQEDKQESGNDPGGNDKHLKKSNVTDTQTNAEEAVVRRLSLRLALGINLKSADKQKLLEIFGHTDVKPSEVPGAILELITQHDPAGIKWLLDLGYRPFDNFEPWEITGSNLGAFPLYEAMACTSYECLETLLKFGEGKMKFAHMWWCFKTAICNLPSLYINVYTDQLAPGEVVPFMRCVKLMLQHGTGFPRLFPIDSVTDRLEKNCKFLTIFFAAGASFEKSHAAELLRDRPLLQPAESLYTLRTSSTHVKMKMASFNLIPYKRSPEILSGNRFCFKFGTLTCLC